MSIFSDIDSFLSAGPARQNTFVIYTNEVLQSQDSIQQLAQSAITFTSLHDITYTNQVNIAFEPLENSQFSSDSLQDTPYTLNLSAKYTPWANIPGFTYKDGQNQLNYVANTLDKYLHNTTLLTLLKIRPLFVQYTNLHLTNVAYSLTPHNSTLHAILSFLQIRQTTPLYGELDFAQVNNSQNAGTLNSGLIFPQTPTFAQNSEFGIN